MIKNNDGKFIEVKQIGSFNVATDEFKKWISTFTDEEREFLKEYGWI